MKKTAHFLLLLPAILIGTLQLSGQSITGRVHDAATGEPLPGVLVWVEGAATATAETDDGGAFRLALPGPGPVRLHWSHLGYQEYTLDTVASASLDLGVVGLTWRQHVLHTGVVVTAQRAQRDAFQAPEALGRRSAGELLRDGARTLPEALTGLTGVWVQKTNHGGGSPFVRGLTGNQTLLLLDGIRLNNTTYRYGPNQYFNTIDVWNVDRVEVVRGAGSVLYGSDALGGVIQVLTPEPLYAEEGWQWRGAAFGRLMTQDMEQSGRLTLGAAGERVALRAGASYRNFGDLVAGGNLGVEAPSAYREWAGDVKVKVRPADQVELTLAYNGVFQSDVGRYDQVAQRGYALWQFDPQNRQLAYGRLHWRPDRPWVEEVVLTAAWQHSLEGRDSRREGAATQIYEEDKIRTLGFIAEWRARPAARWRITSGAEYYHDRVGSFAYQKVVETGERSYRRGLYPDGATAGNLAVFSQHTLELGRWTLNGGARLNLFDLDIADAAFGDVSLQPAAVVGNLSLRYAPHPRHALIASLNTGFRAPNVNDLSSFGPFDFGIETPTSDLASERSWTAELGYKLRGPRLAGSAAFYYTQLYQLIGRVPGTFQGKPTFEGQDVYRKANIGSAFIRGVEADLQYRLAAAFTASAGLAYTYGQNVSDDEPLRRIPPLNGRLALNWLGRKGVFAEIEHWYAGRQDRLAAGDRSDHRIAPGGTPAWNVVNLKAGYQWRRLQFNAGLQNVFNEAYRIHGSGVDGVGRSGWVSVSVSW